MFVKVKVYEVGYVIVIAKIVFIRGNSFHKANTVLSNSQWDCIIVSEIPSYGVTVLDI
jgi:hypothetical protein